MLHDVFCSELANSYQAVSTSEFLLWLTGSHGSDGQIHRGRPRKCAVTPSSSKALLVLFHEYIRVDFVSVCLRHCETPSTTEDEILVARASFLVCSVPPRRFSTLCKADGAALSSGTRCVFFVSAIALSCALMDTLED